MASSLLALIDDIATLLDDVALMTKVAAKKTASVLGDDLAVNAEQVGGVRADRELPVVWAVAKGSLRNKATLIPAALGVSLVAPWLIMPLLMVGGGYLCLEAAEKVLHGLLHPRAGEAQRQRLEDRIAAERDVQALEQEKIGGAIRTDFILSAEIIVITLGTVAEAPFVTRLIVLIGIGLLMTIGVYGVVAAIVKLDDAGLWLVRRQGTGLMPTMLHAFGRMLLTLAPRLMQALSVLGTLAMFLVGGGILVHGMPWLGRLVAALAAAVHPLSGADHLLVHVLPTLAYLVLGALSGLALLGVLALLHRLRR